MFIYMLKKNTNLQRLRNWLTFGAEQFPRWCCHPKLLNSFSERRTKLENYRVSCGGCIKSLTLCQRPGNLWGFAWVTNALFSNTQWNGNLARMPFADRSIHTLEHPLGTPRVGDGDQSVGKQELGQSGRQGTTRPPLCYHSWEQASQVMHTEPAWELTPGPFQPETGCHSDSYQANQKGKLRCPSFFFWRDKG